MECLQFGRPKRKYSPTVRLFCLTLCFYSPRAYQHLRSVFNFNLPSIRTIRYWYSSINGSPGFSEEAFDALRQRADISMSESDVHKKAFAMGFNKEIIPWAYNDWKAWENMSSIHRSVEKLSF